MKNSRLMIGAAAVAFYALSKGSKTSGGSGGKQAALYVPGVPPKPEECPVVRDGDSRAKVYSFRGVRFYEQMRGGASHDDRVPMVFVFHSMASNPASFRGSFGSLGPARVITPFGPIQSKRNPDNYLWFKSGIRHMIKTHTREGAAIEFLKTSKWLQPFLDGIVQCRPTLGKPVFTGSSMGGEMSYLMNTTMPGFAGLTVSQNGALVPGLWSPNISRQIGLHGTEDVVVPYKLDKEYNDYISNLGAPSEFYSYTTGHGYPSSGSDLWKQQYNEMSKKRKTEILQYIDSINVSA